MHSCRRGIFMITLFSVTHEDEFPFESGSCHWHLWLAHIAVDIRDKQEYKFQTYIPVYFYYKHYPNQIELSWTKFTCAVFSLFKLRSAGFGEVCLCCMRTQQSHPHADQNNQWLWAKRSLSGDSQSLPLLDCSERSTPNQSNCSKGTKHAVYLEL